MKPVELGLPIKIWYKPFPGFPRTYWPIIDIKLSYRNISLPQPILSLVDSGADLPILHMEIAEALGVDFKKLGPPLKGGTSASGSYKYWVLPEPIEVSIYGYSFGFKFSVIDNPGLIWPCILGENSIFEIARVDFQKFKGYFEIRLREDIN